MTNEIKSAEFHKSNHTKETKEGADLEVQEKGEAISRGKKRRFPIWLRVLLTLVFMAIFLVIGTMIGYSIVGHGDVSDVFKKETWTHISDIINKKN
ncbi:hypothetical protein A374_17649 [Fictibacillus macauensis ZFHKF-1]|uniref:DNA-directed RNA polymerase subunit beta n=1 Tax=Fictibacillus macauensis ZFHKF-1 TaxID=1196324 RepID=I8UAP7_9BACL|nr:DNA-directed RNA polymerase subunit beta [Fictibacillus macauensis]EIT83883.1 hypothetical protein A374_17649 [Fictibacillus macauensis ZFHKF-1]